MTQSHSRITNASRQFTRCFSILLVMLAPISQDATAEELPATLRWAETATLSTPLSGRVTSVKISVGDRVKKRALLATLDPRPLQAEKKRAAAEVQRLSSQLRIAERELRHAEELFDRTVLSTTALEDAQARYDSAQADLARANAELELAQIQLEYSQIRAPFSGVITEQNIHPGETVSNRCDITPMLRIARGGHLLAIARITPQQGDQLTVGQTIGVTVADEGFKGTIQQIAPSASNPALLELSVSFTTDKAITPGQRAVLEIAQ